MGMKTAGHTDIKECPKSRRQMTVTGNKFAEVSFAHQDGAQVNGTLQTA